MTNININLPPHWKTAKLGEVCKLKNGFAFKSSEYKNEGVPVIRISDIKDGNVSSDFAVRITPKKEFEKYLIEYNDILVAMSGATTGKFGIFRGTEKAYQNQRVGKFQILNNEVLHNDFLYYQINSLKRQIEKDAYGGAQPNISSIKIESMQIALPPLPEQHRIVAKIEESFSELDNGIANLKKAKEQLKVYRQSVLKWAFEGRLTEGWRKENNPKPAKKLLWKIMKEKEHKYQGQLREWEKMMGAWSQDGNKGKKPLKPKKPDEVLTLNNQEVSALPDLPKEWLYMTLGSLIEQPRYGTSKKCTYNKKGYGVIRIPNILKGTISKEDIKYSEFTDDELLAFRLIEGDILIIRSNGSINLVGKCALIKPTDENLLFAGYLIRIRPTKNIILGKYLLNSLLSHFLRVQIESKAKSTSGVNNINAEELKSLIIPLTSLKEQNIVEMEIESRLSVADNLELTIDKSLQQAEALRQSVLKTAFEGKLVVQNPNDEPVEVLLDRIK